MARQKRVDHDRVRALHAEGMDFVSIAKAVDCHPTYAKLIVIGRIMSREERGPKAYLSRQVPRPLNGRKAVGLPPHDHPAIMAGKTLHPRMVLPIEPDTTGVLKTGYYSSKIGKRIEKGAWKGMPVFTLTLEERATCPQSCRHWRGCYGNSMNNSVRHQHGEAFERVLFCDLMELYKRYPGGFVVRLHVLGDFYSLRYVNLWRLLLGMIPPLHVFGYTARWNDEIGMELRKLVANQWDRFAIRFSNAPAIAGLPTTVSIEHPFNKPPDAIICPEQVGKTTCCSTCALCWSTQKQIAFIQH